MKLEQILITTKVATSGMTVREVFAECSRANTPALPFCTRTGRIRGRVTLKNILKMSCLPEYVVETARILGDQLSCTADLEAKAGELLDNPVDPYVLEPHLTINSDASAIKALAIMEQNDTSYLFVVDEGKYRGIVTIQGLARTLAALDRQQ